MEKPPLPTALYCRLSREDGDRMEVSEYADEAQACEDCLCRLSN